MPDIYLHTGVLIRIDDEDYVIEVQKDEEKRYPPSWTSGTTASKLWKYGWTIPTSRKATPSQRFALPPQQDHRHSHRIWCNISMQFVPLFNAVNVKTVFPIGEWIVMSLLPGWPRATSMDHEDMPLCKSFEDRVHPPEVSLRPKCPLGKQGSPGDWGQMWVNQGDSRINFQQELVRMKSKRSIWIKLENVHRN